MKKISPLLMSKFTEGTFGIERETLRVKKDGELSLSLHPSKLNIKGIEKDFSEAQLELVIPVQNSLKKTYALMLEMTRYIHQNLPEDEYLWPFSMPTLNKEEVMVPIATYSDSDKILYREYLAKKYGQSKQLICGIHYNFGFDDSLLRILYDERQEKCSFKEFKNMFYLKLAKNFLQDKWLITYLFGASPVGEKKIFPSYTPVRSIRNSSYGYRNLTSQKVSFDSLDSYVTTLEEFIEKKYLYDEREFYSPIRLKNGKTLASLREDGIEYIEIRMIDINPYSSCGIDLDDMEFLYLFLIYLVHKKETASQAEILEGHGMNEVTALEDPFSKSTYFYKGVSILQEMEQMVLKLKLPNTYIRTLKKMQERFYYPETTLSAQIIKDMQSTGSFMNLGIKISQQYKNRYLT
ncbi:hypothetical protein AB6878_16980 [Carnobacterium maltaromaticum]|uniref:hypothetical protein n=1 Tax=Carnobacterium maltaromaticum TaxID=2751 RepID=UPI0039BDAC28